MTDYQILKRVLYGAEITVEKDNAWLDKYKSSHVEIDWDFPMMLYQTKIIDIDSGNFETGETHFFLNRDFFSGDNKIRYISIKKIDKQLESVRNSFGTSYSKFPTFVRLLEAFDKIKNNELRKQKLKKLYEGR